MSSPFKFLDAYQNDEREMFFGRDEEIESLYEKMQETNLLLLYGASGTGKSSLINCGLSNKYQDSDWLSLFVRRGNNLIDSLWSHIRKPEVAITSIPENITVPQALRSIYLDHFKPIYLIFDQFEELFIQGDADEQEKFFSTISAILSAEIQCKIILSMREEYLAYLSEFEEVLPSLFDHRFRVERMSNKNLRKVVNGTAKFFKINIEDPETTVDRILKNIRDERKGVDLTNLQVYMDRLYREDEERRGNENRHIRFDLDLVGEDVKLDDVLADFLDEQLDKIEAGTNKKGFALDVLLSLVTDDGTKRVMDTAAIAEKLEKKWSGITYDDVDKSLDTFEKLRILRLEKDES